MNTISCCHTQDSGGQLLGIKLPGYWIQLSGSNFLGRTLVMLSFCPPMKSHYYTFYTLRESQHPSGRFSLSLPKCAQCHNAFLYKRPIILVDIIKFFICFYVNPRKNRAVFNIITSLDAKQEELPL